MLCSLNGFVDENFSGLDAFIYLNKSSFFASSHQTEGVTKESVPALAITTVFLVRIEFLLEWRVIVTRDDIAELLYLSNFDSYHLMTE